MKSLAYAIFLLVLVGVNFAHAETVPEWVKTTAKFWMEGKITETEFLNAIKFLINKGIIQIDLQQQKPTTTVANVVIPNGNSEVGNVGFYIPLNLEVSKGTTVVWINDDNIPHTIQSQDEQGNVISLFNSNALKTGERFSHKFNEQGVYHYFCTIHPWRVGIITVR
jgi:plastocyanin